VDVRVSESSSGTLLVRFIVRSAKAPAKQRSWLAVQPVPPGPGAPAPTPPVGQPPAGPPAGQPGPSKGQQALDVAAGYVGTPFTWGGASPATGFDDAGLVQYAYAQVGIALPRVADDQFRVGTAVARAELLPGDLVFFQDATGYVDHVGLYAGNGQFLHAPHTGAVVGYSALSEPYYSQRFAGGTRLV
jgi:cell wall-associated NlpC family hydrolase